ncbi:MAG TPA: WcaF family extracellular polysaccharide biosynthesis acetyltransferase [Chitinophagaceae bacterium]|nr:WcaF family extracellular polysaccharide biosynthesis acetyltransferase [Chitinophagaceae bacterium]
MNETATQKKVRIDTFNNDWYHPGPRWKILLWYFINAVFFISHLNPFISIKIFWLRLFGAKVGKRCYMKPGVNIKYPWKLVIGDYVLVGENVWIDNLETVTLKDHSCISQGAMILTGNHNYKKSSFDLMIQPVTLEEGAWVGAKAVVCPGVTCKSHSVLTVGSVAYNDLEAYTIYSGNPAMPVKERVIT